jgi:hypothetical protein
VAQLGLNPLEHFIRIGLIEGRTGWQLGAGALPGFDPSYYLEQYEDVRTAGLNPLEHFMQKGWKEGRNPSRHFSTKGYLAANPDVAEADINPLLHFLDIGLVEGRSGWQGADGWAGLSDRELIMQIYRAIVARDADTGALEHYSSLLRSGDRPVEALIGQLLASPEHQSILRRVLERLAEDAQDILVKQLIDSGCPLRLDFAPVGDIAFAELERLISSILFTLAELQSSLTEKYLSSEGAAFDRSGRMEHRISSNTV